MQFPPEHCEQAAEETNGGANEDFDTWINNAISKCTQIGAEQVGHRKGRGPCGAERRQR